MKNYPSVRRAANRNVAGRKSRAVPGRSSSAAKPRGALSVRADWLFSKRVLLACLVLIAASAIVYAPVRHFGFVTWDDPQYVYANVHVAQGLTWQGVRWAFTSTESVNWHPVTWLSHMLDVQLYGMNAGPQHLTNLLLHILNTLLLFGLLYRMTGAWGRSVFVAGLFALHPLHVESVAWIAERKDVLSTLFGMLAMWAYVTYVRRPGWRRYLPVLVFFALGLMAKPMLVTLPFVLLLLDFWPLQRVELEGGVTPLVKEKLPLLALAAISSIVTFLVQLNGGAVLGLVRVPWALRLANALASYLAYIGKMLWPVRLAAFYPLGTSPPLLQACLGALLLIGMTLFAIRAGRRHGYLLTGWLWYVGTLIPVIGLVRVGDQSMADRYAYVPLIGLFLIAAWGAPDFVARWRYGRLALPVAAACILLTCAALANAQIGYWNGDTALWQHALDATADNYLAENNVGEILMKQGRTGEAIPHFVEALRIKPDCAEAQNNLGAVLMGQGKLDDAAQHFVEALRIRPGLADAQYNLGMVRLRQGKLDDAARHFIEALRIKPDVADAQNNLGAVLMEQKKLDEAAQRFGEALRIKPDLVEAQNNLGMVLTRQGKLDEAAQHFVEALRIKPDFAEAQNNLGAALMRQGKLDEAVQRFIEAVRLKPDFAEASRNLDRARAALSTGGR
jgi:tetratricopeptide (TPR) repeat protein